MAISENAEDKVAGRPAGLSPAMRLHEARYLLAVSCLLLLVAGFAWNVPLPFILIGFAVLGLTAAFAPRKAATRRQRRADRRALAKWPDTSMKSIINAVRDPAFIVDVSGVVRFANEAAQQQFAQTRPGDLLSLTFRSPALVDAVRAAAEGRAGETRYRERGDSARIFAVEINPVPRPGLKTRFLLVQFHDISEQNALSRMRADFVANASHELRTPLASVTGFIETLQGPARDDPEAQERFLQIMLEQTERMRRLIDDLLSLSRLEMRAHSQLTDEVEMAPLLRRVVDALAPMAEESEVVINLDLPDDPVFVTGDADELTQVFQNLIENGLKYGESGKRLDVQADIRGGDPAPTIAIRVRDFGPGIAEEHLSRLTERFYRVDVETSRQKNGTGLGLAIVKHILVHHRGRLLIESQVDEGATFTIELPIVKKP